MIVGDALYRFKNREKTSAGESCDGFGQNPYPVRKLQSAELTPVGDGKSIPLLDFARPDPDKEVSLPAREERELVAVAPGYLFIKTSTITSSCGAHPMYENEFSLFAVRPNATKELVPESDFAEGAQAKLEQAVQKLNANLDPSTPPESLDSAVEGEQVTVSMAYPTFRKSGPSWTLLYTASATWAGSYGGWSGYTRSVAIELDVAPRRFRDAITMPEVVRAHIAAHPDEEALGFTVGDIQPRR